MFWANFFFDLENTLRYGHRAGFLFSHMKQRPNLYLASASPRRKQLMEALGLSFKIIQAPVEELDPSVEFVEEGVIENARKKALSGLNQLGSQSGIVVAADTLVTYQERVLGKPKDNTEVISMLDLLSGNTHRVVTGLALISTQGLTSFSFVSSQVEFRTISAEEKNQYAATREPYDKAGSYAIQGLGCLFIKKIEGSYTNIMGLPIEKLLEELPKVSSIPAYEWFLPC